MFSFFDTLISFLQTIVAFVANVILSLIYAIKFILRGVTYAFTITAYLPPYVLPFVFAVIGFSIVMFLINR